MKALLRTLIRLLFKPLLGPPVPLALQRQGARLSGLLSPPPRGTRATPLDLGGAPGVRYDAPETRPGKALLFLHGGAYVLGGPASHAGLAARLGRACGAPAFLLDYRLAPEHPYPAALDDALAAYRWLLRDHAADQIAIAGDSAGGNLALALALAIRDGGLPRPAALALISPWTDLSLSGDTIRSHAVRDPMIRPAWIAMGARAYAGPLALDDPRVSPLFARLEQLPPMLIHCGSEEVLLSDSQRLAQRAQAAGIDVTLRCFDGLWHDFQLQAGQLAEADESIAAFGEFLRRHWSNEK